jgi:hypothetical protein
VNLWVNFGCAGQNLVRFVDLWPFVRETVRLRCPQGFFSGFVRGEFAGRSRPLKAKETNGGVPRLSDTLHGTHEAGRLQL